MRAGLGGMVVSSSWCNCGTVTVDDDPKRRVEAREVSLASIERAPGMTAGTRFCVSMWDDRCDAQ